MMTLKLSRAWAGQGLGSRFTLLSTQETNLISPKMESQGGPADRSVVAWGRGSCGEMGMTADGDRVSFWGDKNILKLDCIPGGPIL